MLRAFCLVLLSGCSFFSVGRGSFGMQASTDGTVGLSLSAEMGGGWVDTDREIAEHLTRRGEAVSLYGGGGVSTHGAEIEAGGRAEYVAIGHRIYRLGLRDGVVARQGELPLLVFDAAFGMSLGNAWEPLRVRDVGIELRAGPALTIEDGDFDWYAARLYLGFFAERFSIGGHRYDPLDGLFPGKTSVQAARARRRRAA